jgi:hypothetical protein
LDLIQKDRLFSRELMDDVQERRKIFRTHPIETRILHVDVKSPGVAAEELRLQDAFSASAHTGQNQSMLGISRRKLAGHSSRDFRGGGDRWPLISQHLQ